MDVILLERITKLGQMGDTVRVKNGYGRNYLLPKGKALRATKENLERFEAQRAQLEARNLELKAEADRVAKSMDGAKVVIIRQAAETGQLYGSVSSRDIAAALTEAGFSINRNQILLNRAIKAIGIHQIDAALHPEVAVAVRVNVARSDAEAELQEQGEDLTKRAEGPVFDTYSEDDDEIVHASEAASEPQAEAENQN